MTDLHHAPPPPPPRSRPKSGDVNPLAAAAVGVGVLVLVGITASPWLSAAIVAFVLMIFLHELGHYVTAKRAGMKVTEFFIGFGPRIWSFRRGETEYGLKAIPAGAYVRIIGMNNLDPVPPEDEVRAYRNKPYWRRLSVAVAGSTMHFLVALALLFTIFIGWGMPQIDHWEVGSISRLGNEQTSPALEAGIQLGDRILSVDGVEGETFSDFSKIVQARPGDTVTIVVERDGEIVELVATLAMQNPQGEDKGFLGVGPIYPYEREGFVASVTGSFREFGSVSWASVKGLGDLFSPGGLSDYVRQVTDQDPDEPSAEPESRPISPIGAVSLASDAGSAGVPNFLYFMAAVNIFVGLFNLVPLLPFDGGHVAIATYERIRSRRGRMYHADVTKLLPLTYGVVAVLGLIFITSLYLDIVNPVNG